MFRPARIILLALMLALVAFPAYALAAAPTALIDASTVSGGVNSQEAVSATAQGFAVTVVSDATWAGMTQAQFGAYDLLIAGDPTCGGLPSGLLSSVSKYAPVVMGTAGGRTAAGNRIVIGTDPVYHDGGYATTPNHRSTVIRTGIAFAGKQPGTTGMYFDASCSGSQSLPALTALSSGTGAWTVNGAPPCGGAASMIASNPSFTDLTSASLQGWGCSVHETYPTFASDWSALAVATDTSTQPTCGIDPSTHAQACGQAYVLIAGSGIVVASGSISVAPLSSTDPAGGNHTVTAHVTSGTTALANQLVAFSVTGQNAGASGTCVPVGCVTDSNGDVAFTYSDTKGAGDDTIKASFTDARGSLQAATAQEHWVVASDPPISATGTTFNATEGVGFTNQKVASFTDPDALATASEYSASINWGDGSSSTGTITPAGVAFDVTGDHLYADEGTGTYTVKVTITDVGNPSNSAVATSTANVADAAPTATLDPTNDLTVDEGSTHTYKFTATDDEPVTVVAGCGANGAKVSQTATTVVCKFADGDASSVVSVTPKDDAGVTGDAATQSVTIKNVAPTATVDGASSVDEGSTHNYTYSTHDAGADDVSVDISCGDNGDLVAGSDTGSSFDCSFPDGNADTTVSVTPTDSDGLAGAAATQAVTINNVKPTATLDAGNDLTVNEGTIHTYTFSTSDPGDDTVSVVTSCGANASKVSGSDTATSFQCSFPDGPASTDVSVAPTDSDGTAGDTVKQTVAIKNVAPTVKLSGPNPVTESKTERSYSYTITDPGQDTVDSVAVGCGSNGALVSGSESHTDAGGSFRCVFVNGPKSSTVTASAKDSDGDAGSDSLVVTINDAPIKATGLTFSATEAAAFTNKKVASFTDPTDYSTAAEYSASINWGDGSSSTGTVVKTAAGAFDVTGSHTYTEESAGYVVTVKVTDTDNAANTDTATSKAVVADAAVHTTGVSQITTPQALPATTVASFTDDGKGPLSDFTASINWGDGSAASAGTISGPDSGGKFTVKGSHAFTGTGFFTATVTVKDVGGSTSAATTKLLVYAPASAAGSTFALSDKMALTGAPTKVTFWGSQWEKLNPFLKGSASSGFKGFVPAPAKGQYGCTAPGNSWSEATTGSTTTPPAKLPAYMSVIAVSKESKTGSTISGDIVHMVVVQVGSGYSPDPATAGTGTVVGNIC